MPINKAHVHSSTIPVVFLALTALAASLLLGTNLSGCSDKQQPPQISGTLLPEPRPLEPFQLIDHNGRRFDKESTNGKWTFLFFGYASCPDVCPTTLFQLKSIASRLDKLKGAARNTQFVLVSVDPERDSVEQLEKYIHYFHKDFIALTGKSAQIKSFASQLGIFYEIRSTGDDYLIDHSTAIILLDPDSKLQALFGAPYSAEIITADFLKIKGHYESR